MRNSQEKNTERAFKMENTNKSMQKLKNEKLIELSTEDIKRIQACILDMMKELDEIFQKNNIEYYLGGGSALGSIRHKGFIPWDEDMDINMKRKDCERLIEIYKNTPEFSKKYYLCDNSYDKEFDVNFLRIKLKGTSFKEYLYEDYSKDGVSIDIFPVENMFNNKVLRNIHGFLVTTMLFITSCVRIHKKEEKYLNFKGNEKYSKNIKRKSALGKILSVIKLNTWLRISKKVMMMCKNENSKYISVPTGKKHFWGEMYERKNIFPAQYKKFENIELPVAKENEVYMSKMFGDYMKIPKPEDREKHFICEWRI